MADSGRSLYGQFLLCQSSAAASPPVDWRSHTNGKWSMAVEKSLPITELQSAGSGWLIGWAVDQNGLVGGKQFRLAGVNSFADLEKWLATLSGRFAAFVSIGGEDRFYLDASGSLAVVYSMDNRVLASTPSAIAVGLGQEDSYRSRKAAEPGLPANHFYPGDMTGDDGIRRLLPNHYLDLSTFQPHRYWPTGQIDRVDEKKASDLAAQIAQRTQHCIESFAAKYKLAAGLSAGRDSRMLLACAKNVLPEIEWVTFNYKDPAKFADVHIAQKLASKFRLNYRVLDLIDPPKEMKADYLFRIGYTNNSGKTCDFFDACYRQIDMKRAWLVGYGGEVGRAFYWKPTDADKRASQLESADLLNRMHLPTDAPRLEAMQRWQESMPRDLDAYMLLDLMYQELRLGCWASPQIYGSAPFAANIMPLSNLQTYADMMAMPTTYRLNQRLAHDVIQSAWPQLLNVPFQQLTGWKNWLRAAKRKLVG